VGSAAGVSRGREIVADGDAGEADEEAVTVTLIFKETSGVP
jgi:hypothetical protein